MTSFPTTILVPRALHPAVEERYAFAQARLQLTRDLPGASVLEYEPGSRASEIAGLPAAGVALVLTDPLLLSPRGLAAELTRRVETDPTLALTPSLSLGGHDLQTGELPEPCLTLGQLEDLIGELAGREGITVPVWDESDPGLFAIATGRLRAIDYPVGRALRGLRVTIAADLFAHRFDSQRGKLRGDLLERIPKSARSILEFGCGEGALAAALKARQPCRVVGIELDPVAGAVARDRVDALFSGDVRTLVRDMSESFDWVVGGDIVEHLDDPWGFLRDLRRVVAPGGKLLLSIPNLGCWPVLRDLLRGRFDYVYMGITCAAHLRFFTKESIVELLGISGWRPVSIEPQGDFRTRGYEPFIRELRRSGLRYAEESLLAPGYYVIAE